VSLNQEIGIGNPPSFPAVSSLRSPNYGGVSGGTQPGVIDDKLVRCVSPLYIEPAQSYLAGVVVCIGHTLRANLGLLRTGVQQGGPGSRLIRYHHQPIISIKVTTKLIFRPPDCGGRPSEFLFSFFCFGFSF